MADRVVRVLPDVPAIDKVFDYTVPAAMDADVRVGTLVRIQLHGRRVGGWVVGEGGAAPAGQVLKPIAKVTGWGPPPDVLALAEWAAWRWAGRRASLLGTASPPNAVRGLPPPPHRLNPFGDQSGSTDGFERPFRFDRRVNIVRLPPAADTFPLVLEAVGGGPALILTPSVAEAAAIGRRLRAEGVAVAVHPREWALARAGGVTVVGARAAAWAPMPELSSVVVLDAHDEAYQEERAPTWHARDVAAERARRGGVPCELVSPCPDLAMLARWGDPHVPDRTTERAGWPVLDVVDRRQDDPRTGLFSERLADVVRRHERVVCVLNRKGRARLLACSACGELARCEACGAAVALVDDVLVCGSCGTTRPPVCAACGAGRLKALKLGVARVREELEALAGRPVGEVTAETDQVANAPVLVGTEAVLHRVDRADAVAFLDFDQELLAPRYRAAEQALALLARAGRLLGGRRDGGRLLVQTRIPKHDVLDAALHGDPGRIVAGELERRAALRFPPATALAVVSGPAAPELIERLASLRSEDHRVEVLGPDDGRWLVRADDDRQLASAFAAAGRPAGRLRIEVDPLRV